MKRPWFPFYIDDFLGDEMVRLGDNRLLGVYVRLLAHQWREGSLPTDEVHLAIIAEERPRSFAPIWRKLRRKFDKKEGRLYNSRLLTEMAKADQRSKIAGSSARKGRDGVQRFVYAAEASCFQNHYDATQARLIKIGWSRNPESRVRSLTHPKYQYVEGVRLLGKVPASISVERQAHIELAEHVDAGEWFRPHDDVLKWLVRRGVTSGNTSGLPPEQSQLQKQNPPYPPRARSGAGVRAQGQPTPVADVLPLVTPETIEETGKGWRAVLNGEAPVPPRDLA